MFKSIKYAIVAWLCMAVCAFATIFTSATTGNWSDGSKWSGGSGTDYPGSAQAGDTVVIAAGTVMTLDVNPAYSLATITNSSTNGYISVAASHSLTLTGNPSITYSSTNQTNGCIKVGTGTLTLTGTSTATLISNSGTGYALVTSGAGAFDLENAGGIIADNSSSGRALQHAATSGTSTINGNLSGSGSGIALYQVGTNTVNWAGNATSSAGGYAMSTVSGTINWTPQTGTSIAESGTVAPYGGVRCGGGVLNILTGGSDSLTTSNTETATTAYASIAPIQVSSGTINWTGTWTLASGYDCEIAVLGTGTLNLATASAQLTLANSGNVLIHKIGASSTLTTYVAGPHQATITQQSNTATAAVIGNGAISASFIVGPYLATGSQIAYTPTSGYGYAGSLYPGSLIGCVDSAGTNHGPGILDTACTHYASGILASDVHYANGTLIGDSTYNATGIVYGTGTYSYAASGILNTSNSYAALGVFAGTSGTIYSTGILTSTPGYHATGVYSGGADANCHTTTGLTAAMVLASNPWYDADQTAVHTGVAYGDSTAAKVLTTASAAGTYVDPGAASVLYGVNVGVTQGTFSVPNSGTPTGTADATSDNCVLSGKNYGVSNARTGTGGGGGYTYGDSDASKVLTTATGAGSYYPPNNGSSPYTEDAQYVLTTGHFGVGNGAGTGTHTSDYVIKTNVVSKIYVLTGHDCFTGGDTGNLDLPSQSCVLNSQNYGIGGSHIDGQLTLPTNGQKVLTSQTAFGISGTSITPSATIPVGANVQSGAAAYGINGVSETPAYQTTAITQAAQQATDSGIVNSAKGSITTTTTITFGSNSVVGTLNLSNYTLTNGIVWPTQAHVNGVETAWGPTGAEYHGTLDMSTYTLISGVVAASSVVKNVPRYSGGPNGSFTGIVDASGGTHSTGIFDGTNFHTTTGLTVGQVGSGVYWWDGTGHLGPGTASGSGGNIKLGDKIKEGTITAGSGSNPANRGDKIRNGIIIKGDE